MSFSSNRLAGLAVATAITMPTLGTADVEHVKLQEACNGKAGRAVVSYSWLNGAEIGTDHVFSDVCLDLDSMRVISVEVSEELDPAYTTPMRITYNLYPPEPIGGLQEIVVLSTDLLSGHDATGAEADPDAPGFLTAIAWVRDGRTRPHDSDRVGGSASLNGFVGGATFESSPLPGIYSGLLVENMTYRVDVDSGLSGLGFHMGAELDVTEDGAEVRMQTHPLVAGFESANANLELDFEGAEISGTGTLEAEHSILSPATDRVWKHMDLKTAGVMGQLIGEDGDQMYVLSVWEGTYTDFAGTAHPMEYVMTFHASRVE